MNDRTCNRCNRPLSTSQKKFCSHACANRFNMREAAARNRLVGQKACDVTECGKPARSLTAALCKMHYHRMYRYGTLETTSALVARGEREPSNPRADLSGQRFGTLTPIRPDGIAWLCRCDCGESRTASVGELRRTGDANTCGNKANHLADDVDYTAAHGRVTRLHGPAKRHACVTCGSSALHWSYDHTDPDERLSTSPRTLGIAFSLKPEHYQPRCVPCHKRYDLDRINATEVYGV